VRDEKRLRKREMEIKKEIEGCQTPTIAAFLSKDRIKKNVSSFPKDIIHK
jgi:hypothetical protein